MVSVQQYPVRTYIRSDNNCSIPSAGRVLGSGDETTQILPSAAQNNLVKFVTALCMV